VPDREELIKDDDDDDDNDCEQSDLVSILLNMAYIPEEIMAKFKFETGFYKTFKPMMDSYHDKRIAIKGKDSEEEESISVTKTKIRGVNNTTNRGIQQDEEEEEKDNSRIFKGFL